jgi:hypothetical protein
VPGRDDLAGLAWIRRNLQRAGQVVGGAEGHDAEWKAQLGQHLNGGVQGSVSTCHDDPVYLGGPAPDQLPKG